jgi:hypothetical protein
LNPDKGNGENGLTASKQVSVDFIVAVLCMTVKCLQRTCLPRKSTEIRVDILVEAHTATGFGIYTGPKQNKWPILRESGYEPDSLQRINVI